MHSTAMSETNDYDGINARLLSLVLKLFQDHRFDALSEAMRTRFPNLQPVRC